MEVFPLQVAHKPDEFAVFVFCCSFRCFDSVLNCLNCFCGISSFFTEILRWPSAVEYSMDLLFISMGLESVAFPVTMTIDLEEL